jgi:hypothetical protein
MTPPPALRIEFGRIEISKPHFDPSGGIVGLANAQAVAVADIADRADERLAGAARQLRRAWIGDCDARRQHDKDERGDGAKQFHQRSLSIRVGAFFLFQFQRECAIT